VKRLSEVTDEVLVERAWSAEWWRLLVHEDEDGEVVETWGSGDPDRYPEAEFFVEVVDARSLPEPEASIARARLIARFTGECPVCGAVVRLLCEGEAFDPARMERRSGVISEARSEIDLDLRELERQTMVEAAAGVESFEEALEAGFAATAGLPDPLRMWAEAPAVMPAGEIVIEHVASCPVAPA
jgi:hypothetical protein